MDIYKINTPEELIAGNSYVGRGIVLGRTPDGKKAVTAVMEVELSRIQHEIDRETRED